VQRISGRTYCPGATIGVRNWRIPIRPAFDGRSTTLWSVPPVRNASIAVAPCASPNAASSPWSKSVALRRLEPDPAHPTSQALCAKGHAAPELVYHCERLTHPLCSTRPKGDPGPVWTQIGWDEALNLTARRCAGSRDDRTTAGCLLIGRGRVYALQPPPLSRAGAAVLGPTV